ncbi:MAG: hypothetical protein AABW50_00390 [Nanoarchaeota archaeon]
MGIKIFLIGIKSGQKRFGESIAAVVNSLLLSLVYFIGVGGTSIIAKLSRKHFLDLKLEEPRKSYWEELNLSKEEMEKYYKQF